MQLSSVALQYLALQTLMHHLGPANLPILGLRYSHVNN
jgi:hypothetical protein